MSSLEKPLKTVSGNYRSVAVALEQICTEILFFAEFFISRRIDEIEKFRKCSKTDLFRGNLFIESYFLWAFKGTLYLHNQVTKPT